MGINISMLDLEKYEGRIYMPRNKLEPFPVHKRKTTGSVVLCYKSCPKGIPLQQDHEDLYWWSDVQFVPNKDNELVNSTGAYIDRPGRIPLIADHKKHGLLYSLILTDRMRITVFRGFKTNCLPNVVLHPDSEEALYMRPSQLDLIHMPTLDTISRDRPVIGIQFKACAVAPNGVFMAVVGKYSTCVVLNIYIRDGHYILTRGGMECQDFSPGFHIARNSYENLACQFSMDSSMIAIASQSGLLMVAKRFGPTGYCNLIPGIFDLMDVTLANERSFDFHPAFKHRFLAFASSSKDLYIVNIDTSAIENQAQLEMDGVVNAIKYSPRGIYLAVATSVATIHLLDPCSLDIILTMDGQTQDVDSRMMPLSNGNLPTMIRLSFSTMGEHLAVSSTDGSTRIWQMPVEMRLQHICRNVILQHVRGCDIPNLPLPPKVIWFLLQWPEE